jgi:hypothetical protein
MTLSLKQAMDQIDLEREQAAAAASAYWRERIEQRRQRASLAAKLEQPHATTHTTWSSAPPRARGRSTTGIEFKSQPEGIAGSRWQRVRDGEWVRVR